MKKILSLVLTLLVLCMAGSALADGTHTVVDHGGNEVEVPNKITRVVIDQIPILSTYMSYFGGKAPYIVGFCGSFKTTISETVLKNIAPELMETADTVYAQSDLNTEEIMELRLRAGFPRGNALRYVQEKNGVNWMSCVCAIDRATLPPLANYWAPGVTVSGLHELVANALVMKGEQPRTMNLRQEDLECPDPEPEEEAVEELAASAEEDN